MSYNAICDNDLRDTVITEAIASVRPRGNGDARLQRPLELFSVEIRWISHHGIESEADYVRAERIGR